MVALGITGWVVSIMIGDYLSSSSPWFFNPIAAYVPFLPSSYRQGSFIAQYIVLGLWSLLAALVWSLFIKSRGRLTGSSKFGGASTRKR